MKERRKAGREIGRKEGREGNRKDERRKGRKEGNAKVTDEKEGWKCEGRKERRDT